MGLELRWFFFRNVLYFETISQFSKQFAQRSRASSVCILEIRFNYLQYCGKARDGANVETESDFLIGKSMSLSLM